MFVMICDFFMEVPVIRFIDFSLILIVLVLLIRYVWDLLIGTGYVPVEWENARKEGRISKRLVGLMKNYPDKVRFFTWWHQVERLNREGIPGGFAELGVYKGESACVLHQMDPLRKFHLFDTFSGMPSCDLALETGEASSYTADRFADTHPDEVLIRIAGNGNIRLHPGYFPKTAEPVRDEIFALVNLDADMYKPTLEALRFFYPRLSPGGIIFIHDHNHKWDGIRRAVEEFVKNIPESPVFVADMEETCMIVKNKASNQM